MGIVGHSQHFGKWVRKKGERGRDYYRCEDQALDMNRKVCVCVCGSFRVNTRGESLQKEHVNK
jgi:hypothetical protein